MEFVRLFIGSFYSPSAYQQMKAKQGNGLAYSAVLVSLVALVILLLVGTLVHRELFGARDGALPRFDAVVMQIAEQLPVMSYRGGELHTREPKMQDIYARVELFGHEFKGMVATIDTTGGTTYETMEYPVLVTSREVIMKGKKETKIKSLRDMFGDRQEPLVINQAVATDLANHFSTMVHERLPVTYTYIGLLLWVILTATLFVMRLFMLLGLGFAGLLISRLMGAAVNFGAAMRLAALAMTPVTVLDLLSAVLRLSALGTGRVAFCGLVILTAALYVTREQKNAVISA